MPIYAYRCTSCGHAKDVLQKVSDPLLTDCPACGAATFVKQVTAAGFQLKGSGWYVTDFRGGNGAGKTEGDGQQNAGKDAGKSADQGASTGAEQAGGKPADSAGAKNGNEGKNAAAPAPAAAATPAAPAPSSSGG